MSNNNTKPKKFLELLTDTGRKVIKHMGLLFIVGISLVLFDEYYLKKQGKCQEENTSNWQCNASFLVGNFGTNLFQVALTFWVVDIGLKRETLEEIQEVFKATQATKHIRGFYFHRGEYNHLIEANLRTSRKQEIKILCLAEDLNLFNEENTRIIRRKVTESCHFKILLIHPDSSLVNCLDNTGFNPNLVMVNNLAFRLNNMNKRLQDYRSKNGAIEGSIDVRLHKDLFSPIGYYSDSQSFTLVWMYFSDHQEGSEYPAFDINNRNLIQSADNHFDNLWGRTGKEKILLQFTSLDQLNKTNEYRSNQRGRPI